MNNRSQRSSHLNEEIFEDLLKYSGLIFHICLGFSANASDAEELYQDVYFKAWSEIDSLKNPDSAKRWLLKIARNTNLNHMRKTGTVRKCLEERTSPLVEQDTPETEMIRKEQQATFKKAVRQLPKKFRDVLVMREYGQLSYEEISGALGIRTGTVMSRLSRARRAVLKSLKENGYGTPGHE